jgi:diguanylate cyclase (GGDEF)-like protein/hemerythrin-like metal-binding protein/PAS domain S-box-containing protein
VIENLRDLLSPLLAEAKAIFAVKQPDGSYAFAGREYLTAFGLDETEIVGKTDHDLFPSEVADALRRNDLQVISSRSSLTCEEVIPVAGELRSYLAVRFPINGRNGGLTATGVIAVDISERRRSEREMETALLVARQANTQLETTVAELELLARTDRLTNAWNRVRLEEAARNEMHRMHRFRHPVSIIILDVDNFKVINDRFGHQTGDRVLTEIAETLRLTYRQSDSLTRWGGEEFIVLAPNTTLSGSILLAEKLRKGIEAHGFIEVGPVTASFGVAEYQAGESYDDWVSRADHALYEAKHAGKNQVKAHPATQSSAGESAQEAKLVQLVWRDAYRSGHPLIDRQHQELFRLANELLDAVLASRSENEVSDRGAKLVAAAIEHFRDEEEILRAIGFPALRTHAADHAALLKKTNELAASFASGTLPVGNLFQFLAYDLVALHMLGADREYLSHLGRD